MAVTEKPYLSDPGLRAKMAEGLIAAAGGRAMSRAPCPDKQHLRKQRAVVSYAQLEHLQHTADSPSECRGAVYALGRKGRLTQGHLVPVGGRGHLLVSQRRYSRVRVCDHRHGQRQSIGGHQRIVRLHRVQGGLPQCGTV